VHSLRQPVGDKKGIPLYNYNGATDCGYVLLKHETEIGSGENAKVVYFSLYMHLASINVAVKTGEKVYRKDPLGTVGQVDGRNAVHFQIFCDDANLAKLVGRTKPELDLTKNGRTDAIYGDMHFYLPTGTKFYSHAPTNNATTATEAEVYISSEPLFVSMSFDKGKCTMLTRKKGVFSNGKYSEVGEKLVNHFWLDVQWYLHQALSKAGAPYEGWATCITQDLALFLTRLPGLESLSWSDGTPFADEVTQGWINQQVLGSVSGWGNEPAASVASGEDDILLLEPEALTQADSDGVESALTWLQTRPGIHTDRHQWLLRLVMARVSEQYGKNDMALHLLSTLDSDSLSLTLPQWEPGLVFEVKARRLKLLRMKSQRGDGDKNRMLNDMDTLLSALIAIDPARAAVLCG
jgi:hypothetical protein